MPLPILTCATAWDVQKNVSLVSKTTDLGDGYKQFTLLSPNPERVEWAVKSPSLTKAVADSILSQLATFQGITAFLWSPDNGLNIPREAFFCDKWTLTPLGINAYEITATFTRDLLAPTSAYINTINPSVILPMLEGGVNFLNTYIRDAVPFATNSSGVVSDAFHVNVNQGNYIPSGSGTSEGQAKLILAMTQVSKSAVSSSIKTLALYYAAYYAEALLSYFYAETIPSVPEAQTWLPHWLVTSRSSQPLQSPVTSNVSNSGYFNLQLTFSNGVGFIPTGAPNNGDKLSQVYKVYPTTSKLLYQNVYSPLDVGSEYSINYFVDSRQYRVFPSTDSYSGTPQFQSLSENSGKIVLTSNFNGNATIAYSIVDTTTVLANKFIETYPILRLTASPIEKNHSFISSGVLEEAFRELYSLTGDSKWSKAQLSNKYSTIQTASVANDTYAFKTDTSTFYAFSQPGTQLDLTNNNNPGTIQRLVSGWIECVIYASSLSYPVADLNNYNKTLILQDGVNLSVDLSCSVKAILEVYLSIAKSVTDKTQIYTFYQPTEAGIDITKTISLSEFIQYTSDTYWYSAISANPTSVSVSGLATVTVQNLLNSVNGSNRLVTNLAFSQPTGTIASVNLACNNLTNRIPSITYNKSGSPIKLKVTDSSTQVYYWTLPDTLTYQTFSPSFSTADIGSSFIPGDGAIISIELVSNNSLASTSSVNVWYVGSSPKALPYPCVSYKIGVISRISVTHSFRVGNVFANNSPTSVLVYNPGVVPFAVNLTKQSGTYSLTDWRGKPFVSYQNENMWNSWSLSSSAQQVLDFKLSSQAAYYQSHGNANLGFFTQVYNWSKFGLGDNSNSFTYTGDSDPNQEWSGYQNKSVEITAKYWLNNPKDLKAQTIVMRYLTSINDYFRINSASNPPTNYPNNSSPTSSSINPCDAALICRTALYANIAGGSPLMTLTLIKLCLDFIASEYVASGSMSGSFSQSQNAFTVSSVNYKEYFTFWHSEVLLTLAEVLRLKTQVNYPI